MDTELKQIYEFQAAVRKINDLSDKVDNIEERLNQKEIDEAYERSIKQQCRYTEFILQKAINRSITKRRYNGRNC